MATSLFDKAFAVGTALYVVAFGCAVYSTTESGAAKLGASLLICALPALLAAEASGGDAAAGAELASTWLGEFVGTAVMVLCTCSPGALVGHAGEWAEYLLHYGMMVLADYSCGGPHVNPCVTVTMLVGGDGAPVDALARVLAQLGGGVVGWRLLLGAGAFMRGDVGGPAPDDLLPNFYVYWSEFLGAFALTAAVWAFGTTEFFDGKNYALKMALINVTLRTVILNHGATGPAVNPALASAYDFAASGAWPAVHRASPHFVAYWAGGLCGAAAMGLVWKRAVARRAEATKVAAGVACAACAVGLWAKYLGPEAEAIVADGLYANAMAARHPLSKLLKRKPAAYRA
mmetsp:Transcript_22670/g.68030  ORF Transcript_22670/g.68030 Transcript_22670/m.68030 type:complete len:345 (-) Transcript_22670:63-1097(-)